MRANLIDVAVTVLGRSPSPQELSAWIEASGNGQTRGELAAALLATAEGLARFPFVEANDAYLTNAYQVLFGRMPDAEGLAYWLEQLEQNTLDRDTLVIVLVEGARAETGNPNDAAVTTARAQAADSYLALVESGEAEYDTTAATVAVSGVERADVANPELEPALPDDEDERDEGEDTPPVDENDEDNIDDETLPDEDDTPPVNEDNGGGGNTGGGNTGGNNPSPASPVLTLENALAAQRAGELPALYRIDPASVLASQPLSVEQAKELLAAILPIIEGAENQQALVVAELFSWTIEDSASAISAAADDFAVNGANSLTATLDTASELDLSTITVAGGKSIDVTADVDLSSLEIDLGRFTVEVIQGNTLTVSVAQATSLETLIGEGAVVINGTPAADIMDFSAKTWTVASLTINGGGGIDLLEGPAGYEGQLVLNGGTNADTFVVSNGEVIISDFQAEVDELLVSEGATAVMKLQADTDISTLQAAARINIQGTLRIDLNGFQLNATEEQLTHIVVEDTLANLLALAQEETVAAKAALTASSVVATDSGALTLTQEQLVKVQEFKIDLQNAESITVTDITTAGGDFEKRESINLLSDNATLQFVDNAAILNANNFNAVFGTASLASTAGDTITVNGITSSTNINASGQAADFVFVGNSLGSISAFTTIVGGEGTNTLENVGHVNGNWLNGVSGVDTINWSNINGFSDDVTTADSLVAAGESLTFNLTATGSHIEIDGSAETDGAFVIDGSNMDAASNLTATGGAGNDMIVGGAGNDTLNGSSGNNTLIGGRGSDKLISGEGADVFKYLNALDSIDGAMDEIVNFDILNDKINLREALTNQNHIDFVYGGSGFDDFDSILDSDSVNFQFTYDTCLNVYVAGDGTDTWVFVDFVNHGTYDPGEDMVIQLAGITDASQIVPSLFEI